MEWESETLVDPRTILFKKIHLYLVFLVLALATVVSDIYLSFLLLFYIHLILILFITYSFLFSFYLFAAQTEARRVEILALARALS